VLCATAGGLVPGTRERLVWQAMMAAATGTTRMGALLPRLPGAPPIALPWGRPGTMPAWAAAEVRRHDVRMVIEAGHSISTYHAGPWLPEIDVPTAVVVTAEDRAVAPHLQVRMADAIPGATVHELRDGHLACARSSFAAPLRRACIEVANRA
jgi:pimeloyl-ACP methyl ester carboxylesterase